MTLVGTLSELAALLLALGLTLLVYSYVVGDNPLYRLAVHLLVGVAAGYAVVVAIRQVIEPVVSAVVANPLGSGGLSWLLPVLLAVLFLFSLTTRWATLGSSAMAVLMAVGAAVGLAGAVAGTLIPQVIGGPGGIVGLIVALLTAVALSYFFLTRRTATTSALLASGQRFLRLAGRAIITVALAAVFAGLLNTGLILLAERVGFFINAFAAMFGG
ncbi:MAG: hypothetical protein R3300_15585 [Candidatus Promineifilaceae bacterium]|nr:hypothetical protein [Candidatus Promineifilaceae bacterium]